MSRRLARVFALCGAAAAAAGCGAGEPECVVPAGVYPDWIAQIGCAHDYELVWDDRADSVFAHTSTINWLIDREDDDQVYFIDTKQWELHYFFADAYLDVPTRTPVGTHQEFNLLNYRRPNRRFLLGKLMHYHDQGLLTIELSAGDTADAAMIIDAYQHIAGAIYDGDLLVYRPVSAAQEALMGELAGRIPTIRTEDVFRGQTYQPLNPGVGYGTLRFVKLAELGAQPLLPTELVVLDQVPNDIALVSGIVTGEFQTPLAHINILSKTRGTPNMALRGAFTDPDLRAREGELVRLEVTSQDFTVEAATPTEAQAYWDALRPSQPLVPRHDLTVVGLQSLADLDAGDFLSVGAKAANLAEVMRITTVDIPTPDAPLAAPFSAYGAHMAENGIDELVAALLADHAAGELDPLALQARLFAIRWAIFAAPLDAALLAELAAAIEERWGTTTAVRFRSSTNVEDLAEFSGAGLYTSAGAELDDGEDAIAGALKTVWASAWNYQAFVERDFYRVDHREVRMGVLVHPAQEDELANGVVITINEFAEFRPAFYINSQVGEVSVTNPTGLATPEQILYYTWYEEPEYEVITRSSLLAGRSDWPAGPAVFTDDELAELASYLEAIHQHFLGLAGGSDFAMDIEFKLEEGRLLLLKQARPLKRRVTPM